MSYYHTHFVLFVPLSIKEIKKEKGMVRLLYVSFETSDSKVASELFLLSYSVSLFLYATGGSFLAFIYPGEKPRLCGSYLTICPSIKGDEVFVRVLILLREMAVLIEN